MKSARWVALAALAVLLAGCGAQQQQGRYQLQPALNGSVWRLDTVTGEMRVYTYGGYYAIPDRERALPNPSGQ